MSFNSWNNQAKMTKAIPLQAKNKACQAEQSFETEMFSEKVGKEKVKKACQGQSEKPSPITPATATSGGQKKKKARDVSKITYYSCNKKGHYASNCTEPKN